MNDQISLSGLVCRISILLTLCSATAYQGYAQEADGSDGEIFELSPFTVTTADDRGYLSTNAVSGTSLNTSIRDLPMALEVINQGIHRGPGGIEHGRSPGIFGWGGNDGVMNCLLGHREIATTFERFLPLGKRRGPSGQRSDHTRLPLAKPAAIGVSYRHARSRVS